MDKPPGANRFIALGTLNHEPAQTLSMAMPGTPKFSAIAKLEAHNAHLVCADSGMRNRKDT